jgi:phosphatidylglycerophosphate synthase
VRSLILHPGLRIRVLFFALICELLATLILAVGNEALATVLFLFGIGTLVLYTVLAVASAKGAVPRINQAGPMLVGSLMIALVVMLANLLLASVSQAADAQWSASSFAALAILGLAVGAFALSQLQLKLDPEQQKTQYRKPEKRP